MPCLLAGNGWLYEVADTVPLLYTAKAKSATPTNVVRMVSNRIQSKQFPVFPCPISEPFLVREKAIFSLVRNSSTCVTTTIDFLPHVLMAVSNQRNAKEETINPSDLVIHYLGNCHSSSRLFVPSVYIHISHSIR